MTASTSGLSVWWATPAEPDRFFSSADLDRSDRYHRPLRRVALLSAAAKVFLLIAVCWLVGGLFQRVEWLDSGGEAGPFPFRSLGVGAALTTAALRAPAVAADAWFEYRFRHGERVSVGSVDKTPAEERPEVGFVPAPVPWFVATIVSVSFGVWVVLVLLGAAGYWLVGAGGDWSLTLGMAMLMLLGGGAVFERHVRQGLFKKERPIVADDGDRAASAGLERLAASFGLGELGLYVTETARASASDRYSTGDVPNACAVGLGANRRVVLTESLLEEDSRVREFVIAHEFTHLARRHVLVQSLMSAAVYLLSLRLLGILADSGLPWSWVGLSAADPLGMPMVALILLGSVTAVAPVVAWLTRAQERIADAGAIAALGPLPADQALRLHAQNSADLDPPWWVRLYDQHPAPAERLEFLARHRG